MKKITKHLLIAGMLAMSAINSHAVDYYVSTNGDDANNGATLATAFRTLSTAYTRARNFTPIESHRIIIDGEIDLRGETLTLNDTSGAMITFISADDGFGGAQAVLKNSLGNLRTISTTGVSVSTQTMFIGIEFSGVESTMVRGGVLDLNGLVTSISFERCVFSNNMSNGDTGVVNNGVIYVGSSNTVSFTECIFDGNSVKDGYGGAMRVGSDATSILNRCLFKNNVAERIADGDLSNAGAILIEGAATITNTTFYNNSSTNNGGAVWITANATNVTMTNVSAFGNSVEAATANGSKGGFVRIDGTGGTYTFNNVFFANNSSIRSGNSSNSDIGVSNNSSIIINNSLVTRAYGNTSGITATASQISTAGPGLDVTDSGIYFDEADGLIKFNSVESTLSSPIDLGDASFLTEFIDQNGNTRPNTGAVDAGAWESGQTLSLANVFGASEDIVGFYSTAYGSKIVVKNSAKAEVYNFLGSKIDAFEVNEEHEILNSKYASGVYILKLEIEGKAYTKKFIIQ